MSGAAEAAELDEEFERLQRELDAVTKDISAQGDAAVAENPQSAQVAAPALPTPASESVVVASEAASTITPLPAWQQHLLERDLQDQNAAAALRTEALAVSEREQQGQTSAANAAAKEAASDAAGNGVVDNASHASPQGKWVWNGARWEWKTSKAPPVELPASATGTAQLQPATNGQQNLRETLIGPVGPAMQPGDGNKAGPSRKRPLKRMAAGEVWVDETLSDWPEDDFRIFVGDLAPDAAEHELVDAFGKYKSFNMARIVKDKNSGKCRGYGFVSFASPDDMVKALKEMNGKYVGSRPVKLKKSNWQKRNLSGKRRKELKLFRTVSKLGT